MRKLIMIIVYFIIILLTFNQNVNAQQIIEFTFCKEMTDNYYERLIRISVIQETDTLSFPSIGKNRFLNPLHLCQEPIVRYDRSDSTKVKILVENAKYLYIFEIDRRDLYCPELEMCIEDKRNREGYYKWRYLNCASIWSASFTKRIKKLNRTEDGSNKLLFININKS